MSKTIKAAIAFSLVMLAIVISYCLINNNPYVNGLLIIVAIISSCLVVGYFMERGNKEEEQD